MNTFKFRNSKKSDLDFVINLIKSTFKEHIIQTWGEWDENSQYEYWKKNLKPKLHKIIVFDNTDIGLYSIIEDEKSIELDLIFLIPEFQNKGIGKEIVTSLIETANKKSKSLKLKVLQSNIKALQFYKSLSFNVVKETKVRLYLEYAKVIQN
jgi:ribosomal protein S18 acetylase RimI-like enzyme